MKAVVFHKYGGNEVVEIKDMPVPAPGPDEVLVKVHAASVNPVDWKMRSGLLRIVTGGRFPKILGRECAGEVIAIGSKVTKFKTEIRLSFSRQSEAWVLLPNMPARLKKRPTSSHERYLLKKPQASPSPVLLHSRRSGTRAG